MNQTDADKDLARRRIEAAGLALPADGADTLLDVAPRLRAMTRRVHEALAYDDEPAATIRPRAPQR